MFKKALILSFAFFAALQAAPVYLTFEGIIDEIQSTSSITAPGLGSATIVIMADLDAQGYTTLAYNDGRVINSPYADDPGFYDSFRAEFVSGPVFTGGSGNYSEYQYYYHIGLQYDPFYTGRTYLLISPTDQSHSQNNILLFDWTSTIPTFQLGKSYNGEGVAGDNHGNAYWEGTFILTNISDVPPVSVPEPASLALLSIGLLGLAGKKLVRPIRP